MNIALPSPGGVRVAHPADAGVPVAGADQLLALAGEAQSSHGLSVEDAAPRAIALRQAPGLGMAFPGQRCFTVIGAVMGRRGVQGEPGPDGGSALQRVAGETISALVAAYEVDGSVYALDYRDAVHADLLVGITLSAATTGEVVNLQSSGPLDDSSWSWVLGPVWVGIDGRLTQAPPDDGIDLLIGSAVSATRIALNLQRPIYLE